MTAAWRARCGTFRRCLRGRCARTDAPGRAGRVAALRTGRSGQPVGRQRATTGPRTPASAAAGAPGAGSTDEEAPTAAGTPRTTRTAAVGASWTGPAGRTGGRAARPGRGVRPTAEPSAHPVPAHSHEPPVTGSTGLRPPLQDTPPGRDLKVRRSRRRGQGGAVQGIVSYVRGSTPTSDPSGPMTGKGPGRDAKRGTDGRHATVRAPPPRPARDHRPGRVPPTLAQRGQVGAGPPRPGLPSAAEGRQLRGVGPRQGAGGSRRDARRTDISPADGPPPMPPTERRHRRLRRSAHGDRAVAVVHPRRQRPDHAPAFSRTPQAYSEGVADASAQGYWALI